MQLVSDKELNEASTRLAAGLGGNQGSAQPLLTLCLPVLSQGEKEEEGRAFWEAPVPAYGVAIVAKLRYKADPFNL